MPHELLQKEEKLKKYFAGVDKYIEYNLSKVPEPRILINRQYIKTHFPVREAPVIIASSDHVGTVRALAKNYEAYLDYHQEEQALKAAGAPIFPVFIR